MPSRPVQPALPGFDGLRLFAALSVIFSHAFLVATGTEESEPFVKLGLGNILGLYGVFTFFIISGFLLARSLASNPDAIAYSVNRTLRILPAFAFCILVIALFLGPALTSRPLHEYFSSTETFGFVRDSLNSLGDAWLPGVYAYPDGGDVVGVVNASLWSLRYEAMSYVLLLLLWTLLRSSGAVAFVITAIVLTTWISHPFWKFIGGVSYTLPFFAGGVVLHWVHRRYGTNLAGAIVSVVLLALALFFKQQLYAFAIIGAYLVVFLGERHNFGSAIARRIGDCSYGLYLWGWPSEQIVKQLTHTKQPWELLAMALPLAFALAWISCHLVEQPAMRLRTSVALRLKSAFARLVTAPRPAVVGAKVAFVIGSTLVLTSQVHYWYFLESMSEIVVACIAGAIIAVGVSRLAGRLGVGKAVAVTEEV